MKKITLFILLVAFVNVTVNAQKSWKTKKLDNFSIQYPSEWKSETSNNVGVDLILYAPATSADDTFSENINVVVQDLKGYNLNLDSYTKLSEQQIKSMLKGGKITQSERITNGKIPYHRLVYVGKQSGFNLQFEQRYYVINETAYVLTLTCTVDNFDDYITTARKIFDTFQVK
ncbi:hypothetical protein EZY14_015470 [Kordia sp. TARA_039_SRF]|nr:hypothetical protein EZY14_015470 [Kordia sp. TARA_039_SRF]